MNYRSVPFPDIWEFKKMISHLGRYEILEELGRGAMGVVYKAYDPLIERYVAIKTINLRVLSETEKAEYETRFYQEAKAAGHLTHPNIVTIYDLGESGDVAYIAMELMEGRELQEMIYGKRRLLVTDALSIAIQVAAGLSYAHQRGGRAWRYQTFKHHGSGRQSCKNR